MNKITNETINKAESEAVSGKKTILSGIQPTGVATLGSYLGALRNWAALADTYSCYYSIVDMHAITVRQVPAELRRLQYEQLAVLIACGIDPDKNVLFVQSHVPAHAQLAWVLNCYTMFGELSRMTQFKDKSSKNADNINAGLFSYPALQAADILLYRPDLVPVGADQKQHVELTRDIAVRFNGIYGDVFKLPEPYIPKVGAKIMDLQKPTSKMSKSEIDNGGCVLIMDKPEDIMRSFKRAVTDSETSVRYDAKNKPGVSNLMQIYSVCSGKDFGAIEKEFEGKGYGELKTRAGEAVIELFRPIREEAARLIGDRAYLQAVMKDGAKKASFTANKTLSKVYKKIGFIEL
ncbi:MAG: tryptophan--tRNA ligase [Oscillospiraceae bacterium]|nr:tryptophan--tRNA ligase [Oscillospiraceae bacterium]